MEAEQAESQFAERNCKDDAADNERITIAVGMEIPFGHRQQEACGSAHGKRKNNFSERFDNQSQCITSSV